MGRGNIYPDDSKYRPYEMVYIEYPDVDDSYSDYFWVEVADTVRRLVERLFNSFNQEDYSDGNWNVIAENQQVVVEIADNEWSVAVAVQTADFDGYDNERALAEANLHKYAKKLFGALKKEYGRRVRVRTGAWTSAEYK